MVVLAAIGAGITVPGRRPALRSLRRPDVLRPLAGADGYLAYTSGWFPEALGITLVVASATYLVDMHPFTWSKGLDETLNLLFCRRAPASGSAVRERILPIPWLRSPTAE